MKVCLAGWEVEQLKGFRDGVRGLVVVEVELALMLRVPVDALVRCQMIAPGQNTLAPKLLKITVGIARRAKSRKCIDALKDTGAIKSRVCSYHHCIPAISRHITAEKCDPIETIKQNDILAVTDTISELHLIARESTVAL